MTMKHQLFFLLVFNLLAISSFAQSLNNTKVDGYRAIWFELNQKYEYGNKYSGALGTYTAKHKPLAIYAPAVDQTFFVYGGTKSADSRYLLCMIGVYDHKSNIVSRPTVVFDKKGVDDPHDNPSLLIDNEGYIWVFVSGRGTNRPGFKYKSTKPYHIDEFVQVTQEEMTYPQPRMVQQGFFNFFTKYTGKRQLYFESSQDGTIWTPDQKLAAIVETGATHSGHYQTSTTFQDSIIGTFFNRHPNGNVDQRTDLYYVQSTDFGATWTTAGGQVLQLPLTEVNSPARAVDYATLGKNIYLKDIQYDKNGYPICLYIRSNGHEPGSKSVPYEWCITKWNGIA
ncbi:MAG: BNR-4 repeat-containing protein [Bacteroidota bacterium]